MKGKNHTSGAQATPQLQTMPVAQAAHFGADLDCEGHERFHGEGVGTVDEVAIVSPTGAPQRLARELAAGQRMQAGGVGEQWTTSLGEVVETGLDAVVEPNRRAVTSGVWSGEQSSMISTRTPTLSCDSSPQGRARSGSRGR